MASTRHPTGGRKNPTLSAESLQVLRQCLTAQVLNVGDPNFAEIAKSAAKALAELDAVIEAQAPHIIEAVE